MNNPNATDPHAWHPDQSENSTTGITIGERFYSPDDIQAMTGGERMELLCALSEKVWRQDHPGQEPINDRTIVRKFNSTAEAEGT